MRDVVHRAKVGVTDGAAKRSRANCDCPSHPPHADDADVHAAESAGKRDGAGLGVKFPLAVAHEAIPGAQVPARSDQQSDGQIGHVFGQCAQGRGHMHAAGSAVRQIHRIGADTVDGNHLEPG